MIDTDTLVRAATTAKVPAAVIDETADDILVLLRLPKQVVLDNLAFVQAVSDASLNQQGGIVLAQTPRGRRMLKLAPRKTVLAVWAILGICGAVPATVLSYTTIAQALHGPALRILHVQPMKPSFHKGEPIMLDFVRVQQRSCFGDVDRWFQRKSDSTVLYRTRLSFAGVPLTGKPEHSTIPVPYPAGMEAGTYSYHSTGNLTCDGDGDRPTVVASPPVDITIVD